MVRPIEMSDALSKVDIVERLLQAKKNAPEVLQQFQKALSEKIVENVKSPTPVPDDDEVVLHIDEEERGKRKTAEDEKRHAREYSTKDAEGQEKKDSDNDDEPPHLEHIDIKV